MTAPNVALVRADANVLERRDLGWWGMWIFIGSEAALFAYLIASYFYLGNRVPTWPPLVPEIRMAGINTIILLASSGTAFVAERSIKRGARGTFMVWLLATIILGITFLSIQVHEYSVSEIVPQTDAYGSAFYLVTGTHGAHVTLGLAMLVYVLIRAVVGHFSAVRHSAVRNVILYWHFVDVVWLVVFTSLYVVPNVR